MIEKNFLYQDNKSTILLAKNGRMSAGKNSKHIKNRFFLITDKVAYRELDIPHMGTKSMRGVCKYQAGTGCNNYNLPMRDNGGDS